MNRITLKFIWLLIKHSFMFCAVLMVSLKLRSGKYDWFDIVVVSLSGVYAIWYYIKIDNLVEGKEESERSKK